MPSCVCRFLLWGAIAVEARRRRADSASTYIYNFIYIYEHEAIQKPISENNIGAPLAPHKFAACGSHIAAIGHVPHATL